MKAVEGAVEVRMADTVEWGGGHCGRGKRALWKGVEDTVEAGVEGNVGMEDSVEGSGGHCRELWRALWKGVEVTVERDGRDCRGGGGDHCERGWRAM